VPASAVFYASATIQPGADQVQALQHIVNRFGGSGTWNRFLTQLNQSLSSGKVSYDKDFKPWIGDRVGFALTAWPANIANSLGGGSVTQLRGIVGRTASAAGSSTSNSSDDVLLVFPTEHPDKARQALPTLEQGSNASDVTGKVVGNYVLFGGRPAVNAAQSVSAGNSLAGSSAYKAIVSKARANALASFYLNLHSFVPVLKSAARNNPSSSQLFNSPQISKALSMLSANASALASISVTNQTIAFDVAYHGVGSQSHPGSANVGSLPGDSWLAVALPGISTSSLGQAFRELEQINTVNGQAATGAQVQQVSRLVRIIDSLFPDGIGQSSLSIAGASQSVKAGLSLDAKTTQDASRVVGTLHSFLAAAGASVSGGASGFSVPAQNFTLRVGSSGSNVTATLGYPSPSAFSSPSSKLSDNATYKTAVGQLASGSNVPLYLSFDKLLSVIPNASAQTESTLKKLSYLIVGTGQGDFRIVLGLH